MKHVCVLLLFVAFNAQSLSAQKITFKDLNLKRALLEGGYDFNKDGEIEVSEIDTVKVLNISKKNIKSVDDLVWFKDLKSLNANSNQIHNLDAFFNNQVIEEIFIGDNLLGKKLTLKNAKNLNTLIVFKNGLEEIDLSGTSNIKWLYLQNNRFSNLEFKSLLILESLQLDENPLLKSVDISSNSKLKNLYLLETAITQVDVSNNALMNILYIDNGVKLKKSETQANLKPMPLIRVQ